MEGDGRGFHGYAADLLVLSAVQIAGLAGGFQRDDPVRGQESVGKGGFAVVYVGEDADVADVLLVVLQRRDVHSGLNEKIKKKIPSCNFGFQCSNIAVTKKWIQMASLFFNRSIIFRIVG